MQAGQYGEASIGPLRATARCLPSRVRLIRGSSLAKHPKSRFLLAEFVQFLAELLDQLLKSRRIFLLRDQLAELLPAFLKWPFHAKKRVGQTKSTSLKTPREWHFPASDVETTLSLDSVRARFLVSLLLNAGTVAGESLDFFSDAGALAP